MRKRGRDGAGKSGGWLGVSREDGGRKTGVDRSESDQKIERKRGIEKQRTTPKVYSPRVPSTHIWLVGSLPLFSLCLSLFPSLTPHSLFFAMPSMNVLPYRRLWERMCHVKAGYCKPMRENGSREQDGTKKVENG